MGKVLVESNNVIGNKKNDPGESHDTGGNFEDDAVLHKVAFSGFGIIVLH